VDRRRRSVVSDFAGNWVFNNFFVKEILLGFVSGSEKSRLSLSAVCWFVTEIRDCRWWMELSELKKERSSSSSKKIQRRRRREKRR
jgi:hypothetical protein